jgi:hypothetical protein
MNQTIKKIEDQHKEHLRILKKNDGETHFDRVMKREKEDPGVHIREHWNAVAMGQKNADNFMKKVTDPIHPDHAEALTAYIDKYDGKRENVESDHINKAVKLMDAPAQYLPNQAYERNVLSAFQIRTPEDQAFLNKFTSYMKDKWGAVGYEGDANFYKDFFAVHPMSAPPVKTLGEDGKIYPMVIKH